MKMKSIWMCEDLGDASQSSFGKTKRDAELSGADNRGYASFAECKTDGWVKPAVRISVPAAAADALLRMTADV